MNVCQEGVFFSLFQEKQLFHIMFIFWGSSFNAQPQIYLILMASPIFHFAALEFFEQ